MHMLAALSGFERGRLRERVRAAWRAPRRGDAAIGRPAHGVSPAALQRVHGLSVRAAAKALEVSPALVHKLRSQTPGDFRLQDEAETQDFSATLTTVHEPTGL